MSAPDPTPGGPPPPRRRMLRIVLLVSLAFNLLVLGVVAGAWVSRGGTMAQRAVMMDVGFGPYTRALDEAGREAVREAWRAQAPEPRAILENRRAEVAAFLAALRAEPFERGRIDSIFAEQRARMERHQGALHRAMSAHIGAMTAQERAAYAERLEAAGRMSRRRPPPGD